MSRDGAPFPYQNPAQDEVRWVLRRFADRRTWMQVSPSTAQMVARLLAERDKVTLAATNLVEALEKWGVLTLAGEEAQALAQLIQALDAMGARNGETPDQAEA